MAKGFIAVVWPFAGLSLKIAPSCGGSAPPSNSWFLSPQTALRSAQPFLLDSPVCPTHRSTDHATCDICSNWPHRCTEWR